MPRRFPLYAKILLWFFLNLFLLVAAFYVLFRGQFRLGLDWLLSGSANDRIESVSKLIFGELATQPQAEWNAVLKRYDNAYQDRLRFFVFRDLETQVAGEPVQLPVEVRVRLGGRRGPGVQSPSPDRAGKELDRPSPTFSSRPSRTNLSGVVPSPEATAFSGDRSRSAYDAPRDDAPLRNPMRGPHPKMIVHTDDPSRYWVLVQTFLRDAKQARPMPATLVIMTSSLSGGGLLFDVKPWIAVGFGALVFSVLFWLPLVRGINRSIAQMTQATRQIAEGRFEVRVNARRRDELGELGHAVNQMAVRLAGLVAGQKRFLGDVAHELCSPLAKLRMALGILEQRTDGQQKAYVNTAEEKAEQMAGLVNELLSFSRTALGASSIQLENVSVRDVADKAVRRETTEGTDIQVDIPADDLWVTAEPELLARALSNLVRNAIRYAGRDGPITVSARPEYGDVLLTVSDCGPGVPESELAQVFDPFYRVDNSRDRTTGGVGLGLAIVKTCVETCQGTIRCRNRQPKGLEVTLRLPAGRRPQSPETA